MTRLARESCTSVEGPKLREGTSAILVDSDGRLLLQLRDDLPNVSDAGKISLFGGRREGDESFLECVVREVHEEIGYYLPPERFEKIGSYLGPDHVIPNGMLSGEIFIARDVPLSEISVVEGALMVVAVDELHVIRDRLALPAKFALGIFLETDLLD